MTYRDVSWLDVYVFSKDVKYQQKCLRWQLPLTLLQQYRSDACLVGVSWGAGSRHQKKHIPPKFPAQHRHR